MPRTLGAVGRPKHIKVKLSDINNVFKPDTEIDISISYSCLFNTIERPKIVKEGQWVENNKEEKIEFTIR